MRRFPVGKGRRSAPGWYWSATDRCLVHHGFKAMRTQLMMLDHDPVVTALACRPMELLWHGRGGRTASHAPHLTARVADGSGLLVDCASRFGAGRQPVRRAARPESAAAAAGWHYRLIGPPPVVEANVRRLAGHRHPRCAQERVCSGVRLRSARPRTGPSPHSTASPISKSSSPQRVRQARKSTRNSLSSLKAASRASQLGTPTMTVAPVFASLTTRESGRGHRHVRRFPTWGTRAPPPRSLRFYLKPSTTGFNGPPVCGPFVTSLLSVESSPSRKVHLPSIL